MVKLLYPSYNLGLHSSSTTTTSHHLLRHTYIFFSRSCLDQQL
jgi:hypothetical protein